MNITEIFKNSLTYPVDNWKQLLILGVISIIVSIFVVLDALGIAMSQYLGAMVLGVVSAIIALVAGFIVNGYLLSVTRKTIDNPEGEAPEFDWIKNLVDGIKLFVLSIVYYIIPIVVTLIVAFLTGAFGYIYQIVNVSASTGSTAALSDSLLAAAGGSFLIVAVVALILFVIFSILLLVATAKLAETDSLSAAVHFGDVFNKISEIGWGDFIIWLIIYAIICYLIIIIFGLVSAIPFVGVLIATLIISPFVQMFAYRALGLIYLE